MQGLLMPLALLAHTECCTSGDPIQHDGMALHRSQETKDLLAMPPL